jgi:cholesterol transport system auxiliary component
MSDRRPSFRRLARASALATALALSAAGCQGLLPGQSEPAKLYTLTPKTTFNPDLPKASWQLSVDVPIAEAGLNATRIALRRSPVTLDYYANAEWVDRAPLLAQRLLVESFEATGKIVAVARQSVNLRSDYTLICELREFQAEYDGGDRTAPNVRVRLTAKLVKMPERVIVGSTTSEYVERAEGTDLDRVVLAFDAALGKVLRRIVEWTFQAAIVQARPEER